MRALIPIVLLLSACGQPAEQPAANQAEPQAAEQQEAAPVPSLAGSWTITTINGAAPDQVWPMTVSVGEGRFTIASECRRMAWSFNQDRNIVELEPAAGADCPRVRSPAEIAIEKPLNLANIAIFSNEGAEVQLSGPGGTVTMVRR
jgi:hypothetical protein